MNFVLSYSHCVLALDICFATPLLTPLLFPSVLHVLALGAIIHSGQHNKGSKQWSSYIDKKYTNLIIYISLQLIIFSHC